MVDVFEEVEDQLRTERYKQLALKVLPWVLGALLVAGIVAGVWYWVHKSRLETTAEAASAYSEAVSLLTAGNGEAAFLKFGEVAENGPPGYKSLALSVQGAIRLEDGKTKEAVELFDASAKAAPKGDAGLIIADSARLKSAFALMDDAPYADIEARLKPLTEEDRPYRALAREGLALAKLNAGKIKEAREDFDALTTALYATPGVIERSRAAIDLIDSGGAASIPAVVKAAKALPVQPPVMPGAPQQGQPQSQPQSQPQAAGPQGAAQ